MFDDCKGEKLQELLASFSTFVLRKVLANGQGGRPSIAGRFAIARRVTVKEHASFLPLAIAHRASLTALLQRKRDLKTRYEVFGSTLDAKEQELDQRFGAIVQTQEYLDANPIPDHTVSRVSKLFEKNWQGDNRLVNTIARGEHQELKDTLLDAPFPVTWARVSEGTFDGPTELSSHGLLADLEKRVAEQEVRLNQWKDFKEAMKKDVKHSVGQNMQSPTLARAKMNTPALQKQRDLVFSPRKSPRKSDWGLQNNEDFVSPTSMYAEKITNRSLGLVTPVDENFKNSAIGKASKQDHDSKENQRTRISSSSDDSDQSGFSEISAGDQLYGSQSTANGRINYTSPSPAYNGNRGTSQENRKHNHAGANEVEEPQDINEDDLLANEIISMTLNAAPTPAKPKLSLVERTRQSIMASSTPSGLQPFTVEDDSPLPHSLPAITENLDSPTPHHPHSPTKTLLERTRQSISLLPPKPRQSNTHDPHRRSSKIYPTNQFETPRKGMMQKARELTPPEELFSPGAGYDSVFKSRPKVGFSPVGSPELGDGGVEDDGMGDEESPLARATTARMQ